MLAHSSLATHLRLKFILNVESKWSYSDIDNLRPWELEVHTMMLEKYIADKNEKNKK